MVVSGEVVAVTAPQPMMMSSGGSGKILSLKVDFGGGCNDVPPPSDVPPALGTKGVTSSEWQTIKCHIDEHRAANGWNNCPIVEGLCALTCFCACVGLIPLTVVGNYPARFEAFKERRIPEINAKLNPHGLWAKFKSGGVDGETLIFYAR